MELQRYKILFSGFIILSLLVLTTFLFVGGPISAEDRLQKMFWEMGHFFLFAIATFSLFTLTNLGKRPLLFKLLFTLVFCVVFGFGTEYAQLLVGRNFELKDVLHDFVGGFSGLTLSLFSLKNKRLVNLGICIIVFVGTVFGCRDFLLALWDEYRINKDFPVLADFESGIELKRWRISGGHFELSEDNATSGENSLKVDFRPARYSDLSMDHFASNWVGYNYLTFNIESSAEQPINLYVKIYDYTHYYSAFRFYDRFNGKILVNPGNNKIRINLEDVRNAPRDRPMLLNEVWGVSIFAIDLKEPYRFYLDDVRLEK